MVPASVRAGPDEAPGQRPHVRVLLATHNGEAWLEQQLQTIADQQDVRVSIVASDDASTDATTEILRSWSNRFDLLVLPPLGRRLGNANRNFMRLIADAPLDDADFIAFADQDDIWKPAKLARAITCLDQHRAAAYSSNVTAFWPDGRERHVRKSHAQRSHDYLFGSPGPGCTYVLRRPTHDALRTWVRDRYEAMQQVWVHDWLIYAFVRSRNLSWHIDDDTHMLYRQHGGNEFGANAGWQAALKRWQHVRSGLYRGAAIKIADAIADESAPAQALRRLRWQDRVWLLAHSRQFRRRMLDSAMLGFFFLVMPRLPKAPSP
jgi:rhamnosyltransferase